MTKENLKHTPIWEPWQEAVSFPTLSGEKTADVVIIGGGITGITTAYHLAKSGLKVIVLEQNRVGTGTTGYSTGNLYAPIDERSFSLESKHGKKTKELVTLSRINAVEAIEQRISLFGIDCEFHRVPFHLFYTEDGDDHHEIIIREEEALRQAGLNTTRVEPHFPFDYSEILSLHHQAQFNPLKYIQQFASIVTDNNCSIFENSQVVNIEKGETCCVETSEGSIKSQYVVMATHTPKGIYGVQAKMETYREFALAARIKGELPPAGIYWHLQGNQKYSLRPYQNKNGNHIIVLGEPYLTGDTAENNQRISKLKTYLTRHFEVEEYDFLWAGQNYKPADHIPYIGTSLTENNIYIGTGFSADGLVYGTLAGMIIADSILGNTNPYQKLYNPSRLTPVASAERTFKENVRVVSKLAQTVISSLDVDSFREIKPGEGKITSIEDKMIAAYRDEKGNLHTVSAICPHMGCKVCWNKEETSWDCPCHGSRFSVAGDVLEGPAYRGLTHVSLPK